VSVLLSEGRYCCGCFKELKAEELFKTRGIPVALCSSCFSKVYHGYWECLEGLLRGSLALNGDAKTGGHHSSVKEFFGQGDFIDESYEEVSDTGVKGFNRQWKGLCEDIFNPRCQFPLDPELLNPCLKNHGIGLLMEDSRRLKILIGSLESIKYQMIWNGGLFGVILGRSKQILNLPLLSGVISEVQQEIKRHVKSYNASINGASWREMGGLKRQVRILNGSGFLRDFSSFTVNEWILLSYWSQDMRYVVKQRIQEWLMPSITFLIELVRKILEQHELEIVDYHDIMDGFTPLSENLRSYLENHRVIRRLEELILEKGRWVHYFDKVLNDVAEHPERSFFNQEKFFGAFNNSKNQAIHLEIEEIMGAFGQFLIVKPVHLEFPTVLTTWELIGKSFR